MKKLIAYLTVLLLGFTPAMTETVLSNEIIVSESVVIVAPTPAPTPKAVRIDWECGELPNVLTGGTSLKIVSKLTGFDDAEEICYQWCVDKHDGYGFVEMENETGDTLIVIASAETLRWDYQLIVYWR